VTLGPPVRSEPDRTGPIVVAGRYDVQLRVGIMGGGQLARMLAQAAIGPGIGIEVLAAPGETSAADVVPSVTWGEPSLATLRDLAERVDVVTFDHEGVDPAVVAQLATDGHVLRPGAVTLSCAVDKLTQRRRLADHGLPVPAFAAVDDAEGLARFAAQHGWPVAVKTPTGGYDGRGVWLARDLDEAAEPLSLDRTLLVEEGLDLASELAVVVARRPAGETVVYPLLETVQDDGICVQVRAPAPVDADLAARAEALALAVAEAVDAVGVLAVELFVTTDGRLLVNEIAARPHNSGHLSIEACETSQFENHLRAVLDLPLGPTTLRCPAAAMVNVLAADETTDPHGRLTEALELGPVHVHLYGKASRPGRKIGHVTVLGETVDEAAGVAAKAASVLGDTAPAPTATIHEEEEAP
jgi:5-(carboxyamino)imidazole ribonucleotide synthase